MSNETRYTMYRRDARGTIEVDLHDPVYSLNQLIEKQEVVIATRDEQIEKWRSLMDNAIHKNNEERAALERLIRARDAVKEELELDDII